jgi:hypothetical protein
MMPLGACRYVSVYRMHMSSCRVPASLAGPLLASWLVLLPPPHDRITGSALFDTCHRRNDHATQNQTKETLIDTTSTTAGAAALRSSVLGVKLTPAPDMSVTVQ